MSRWEEYISKVKNKGSTLPDVTEVSTFFPFHEYFANAPQPIFKGRSYEEDMEIAEGCFRHIKKIFTQLEVRILRVFFNLPLKALSLVVWVFFVLFLMRSNGIFTLQTRLLLLSEIIENIYSFSSRLSKN